MLLQEQQVSWFSAEENMQNYLQLCLKASLKGTFPDCNSFLLKCGSIKELSDYILFLFFVFVFLSSKLTFRCSLCLLCPSELLRHLVAQKDELVEEVDTLREMLRVS